MTYMSPFYHVNQHMALYLAQKSVCFEKIQTSTFLAKVNIHVFTLQLLLLPCTLYGSDLLKDKTAIVGKYHTSWLKYVSVYSYLKAFEIETNPLIFKITFKNLPCWNLKVYYKYFFFYKNPVYDWL